jgi:hypothetical protein
VDADRPGDATVVDSSSPDADATVAPDAPADRSTSEGGDAGETADVYDARIPDQDGSDAGSTDAGTDATDSGADADAGVDGGGGAIDASTACGPCTGTVLGGRCIETLATGQTSPYAIAADGVNVYWTNSGNFNADAGSVVRVGVCGGTPATVAAGVTYASSVAVDGTHLYWTDESSIHAWTRGTGTVTALATNQASPTGLTLDAKNNLYFANNTWDGGILRVPIDGGPVISVVPHVNNGTQVLVTATYVYWLPLAGSVVLFSPLTAPNEQVFFYDSNYQIQSVAIDCRIIYYTEQSSLGPVGVIPLDGGAVGSLANDNGTWGVASDGTYVYYTSPNGDGTNYDGAVLRVPIAGGSPVTLATGGNPEAIAIDATSVYWTSTTNASVMKVSPR